MSLPPHKHYDTPGAALQSKAFLTTEGAQVVPCGCGKFRVLRPAPPRAALMRKSAPKGRRDTGPDRKTRELVLARDGYRCVCCGTSITGQPYSLQHRKRRSQGGDNSPANLVTVLGTGTTGCHERIDSRRDPEDEAKGYAVRSYDDPALIPVMIFSGHGSGITVWLLADGTYGDSAPSGVAA